MADDAAVPIGDPIEAPVHFEDQGEGEIHSVDCRRRLWPERLRRDQIQSKPFSAKPSIVVSSMPASVISLAGLARQAIEPNSDVYLDQCQCRLPLPFAQLRGRRLHLSNMMGGAESSALIFGPSKDRALAARGRELKSPLEIRPDLRELRVNYGGYSGRDDEIDMITRSMLQIVLEFAAVVQVPKAVVDQGKAAHRLVETQGQEAQTGPPMRVLVTDTPPKDAYVAVQYDERWVWIPDTDIQ